MIEDSFICVSCEEVLDVKHLFYSEHLDDTYCEECGDEAEQQIGIDMIESRNDLD